MNVRTIFPRLALALALCTFRATAAAVDDAGTGSDAALTSRIDALLAEPGLRGGFQALVVRSLRDGRPLYERNASLHCLPASNQKLLTSAAVLHALGPDWRYATTVLRTQSVDVRGVMRGDLILKGSGDPVLDESDLAALARAVRQAGVRRVTGRLIVDETRFPRLRYGAGWSWDDMPYYYSPQVSGLNLNENLVRVAVNPGQRAGLPATVTVTPPWPAVRVANRARTAAAGAKSVVTMDRQLGANVIVVDGLLAIDAKPEDHRPAGLTIEDPPAYAAWGFRRALAAAGVNVLGGTVMAACPAGVVEVARHLSVPMNSMLKRLNKPSDNLVAECLLRTLGAESGRPGTPSGGTEAAMAWFRSVGVPQGDLDMADGSGLSRQNLITARGLALVLEAMARHPHAAAFVESLPIAGVDGGLRNRMKGTIAASNCRAKTGYVSGVSSLSGYVTTRAGEPLLFVILMNNHLARNALAVGVQDRIVVLLADLGAPATRAPASSPTRPEPKP